LNGINKIVSSGRLVEQAALRYTPAGIPVIEFSLAHESMQMEAGAERQVQCEMHCICLGSKALELARLNAGCEILVKGFLAAKNRRWPAHLLLHVTDWQPAQVS